MKTEKAMEMYVNMMIDTIKGLKEGWKKGWFTTGMNAPENVDGKAYNGFNNILLWMLAETNGYKYPVFVTFNRCKQMGAHVKKGAKAAPVFFWKLIAKNDKGEYVDADKADKDAKVFPVLRCFDVFNVEQTTIEEDAPKEWEKITKRHKKPTPKNEGEMYVNDAMDKLIGGDWLCPVKLVGEQPKYIPSKDIICVPPKNQFEDGMEFYSTVLHEMAHSTGAKSRLDRLGKHEYGREELVAELAAAICGQNIGLSMEVQKNNAAYLSGWLKNITEEPKFLFKVLGDATKAVDMIQKQMN